MKRKYSRLPDAAGREDCAQTCTNMAVVGEDRRIRARRSSPRWQETGWQVLQMAGEKNRGKRYEEDTGVCDSLR